MENEGSASAQPVSAGLATNDAVNGPSAAPAAPRSPAGKKIIFVGSSKEARTNPDRVSPVIEAIEGAGLAALPWWDAFPLSDYTLERLLELTHEVDGAIFIATADDKRLMRDKESQTPRDNVVFELGMFASALGRKRSFILKEASAQIPSDLAGLTYITIDSDIRSAANKAADELQRTLSQRPTSSTTIVVCDSDLVPTVAGDIPSKGWLMRRFYFGTEGARAWLAIARDPRYRNQAEIDPLKERIDKFIKRSPVAFRTFVSLGPGDGVLDERIAITLRSRDHSVSYVPIDLSDGLLLNACKLLARTVSVPAGIFADFEDKLDFVVDHVRDHSKGPYLYGLFGGTFGNVDGSEAAFIDRLVDHLDENDELIMDVTVKKLVPPKPKTGKRRVQVVDSDALSAGQKAFFAHGVAVHLGMNVEEIMKKWRRVQFEELSASSVIPQTQTILFKFKEESGGEDRLCAQFRRYDLDQLIKWLQDRNTKVVAERIEDSGPFDRAVLSVRRAL